MPSFSLWIPTNISMFCWMYVSRLIMFVLFCLNDLPKIFVSTTFGIMLLYFSKWILRCWNYLLSNSNRILLVQWKVREHELDCLSGRSEELIIIGQLCAEGLVNNERDKVCRILSCGNVIYFSTIWSDMKKFIVDYINRMNVCVCVCVFVVELGYSSSHS